MANNDKQQESLDKQVAIAAQSFQQFESISIELKRLNENLEKYLRFNHIGDE